MSITRLTASVFALSILVGASQVRAGDRDGYPEPRSYEDEFGESPAHAPPRASTKDDPLPPPPRYSQYRERGPACTPRQMVYDRLVGEGWRDFHDTVVHGPDAVVLARRPSGDLYKLRIDRCSGEIVGAHRVRREVEPDFAYEPRGPRWDGPYYRGPRHWVHERRGWGRRYW